MWGGDVKQNAPCFGDYRNSRKHSNAAKDLKNASSYF
jgi:hypothetical protein